MPQATTNQSRKHRSSIRKAPRGTVTLECRRGCHGLGPNLVAAFLDVSESGLRFVAKAGLKPREEVEVLFMHNGQRKPLKRQANVCWSLPLENGHFCVGLAFQKWLSYPEVQLFTKL